MLFVPIFSIDIPLNRPSILEKTGVPLKGLTEIKCHHVIVGDIYNKLTILLQEQGPIKEY